MPNHTQPNQPEGSEVASVTFILEDPKALTGTDVARHELHAAKGQSLLDLALSHGIQIEHACGGVCACSTCHIYINEGDDALSEPEDEELDRVEEAPGLQINSRLACQCIVQGHAPIVVQVPAWNRNAVKETPH